MGTTPSSPLDLTLAHWQDMQDTANNNSVNVRKRKRVRFCSAEWPTLNVGWPAEGTFDLAIIQKIEEIVFRPRSGYPDQIPYVVTWQGLIDRLEGPLPWVKPFLPARKAKQTGGMPEVLQGGTDETELFPPPYSPRAQPTVQPTAPPPEPALAPQPPRGPAQATRSRRGAIPQPDTTVALPLRPAGPPDEDRNQPFHYWPFTTSDLYNWKAQNAPFSKDPQDLINLLETVLFTHQPTFDHCQQLLGILFTIEERGRILEHAQKLVPGPTGDPLTDPAVITAAFPSTHPNWDYNAAEGKESLRVYRQARLAGLKAAARKPTNMAKVYDIRQGVDESPAAYLERLMTAFKQYTPYDPESPMTTQAVILAYINQAAPDIRKKLQSLDRLGERNLRELVAVAEKVYNERDRGAEGRKERETKTTKRG
uniref:Core shell protein Gag P30 domain-containing protein n=1 Tax=Peromyscus maniculatus bairdii TaxID=230844 RepID=A0A8C8U412_PERMB